MNFSFTSSANTRTTTSKTSKTFADISFSKTKMGQSFKLSKAALAKLDIVTNELVFGNNIVDGVLKTIFAVVPEGQGVTLKTARDKETLLPKEKTSRFSANVLENLLVEAGVFEKPDGLDAEGKNNFPEFYKKKFNFVSLEIEQEGVVKMYTLVEFVKPEGDTNTEEEEEDEVVASETESTIETADEPEVKSWL
jgi:hypothetical protein